MDEEIIKQELDTLEEFQEQKALLLEEKRKLLEDVQIPQEIQAIVNDGNRRTNELKIPMVIPDAEFDQQIRVELDAIVIPDEIKEALSEIDRKRALVAEKKLAFYREKEREIVLLRADIERQRQAIQEEVAEKVNATYHSINQRRAEIEAEFGDKQLAVDQNIEKLKKDIVENTIALGRSVRSGRGTKMAVYSPGRTTWNTDGLDELIIQGHEELKSFRKVGKASASIRDM